MIRRLIAAIARHLGCRRGSHWCPAELRGRCVWCEVRDYEPEELD